MKKLLTLIFLLATFLVWAQESYYSDVNLNLTGLSLKNALATKITTTHTNFLTYTPDVWEASRVTDENPNNTTQVLLIYGWENGTDGDVTNDRARDKFNNGGSIGEWNREHVYPRSLGTPNLGTDGPGADAHSLRPSDVSTNSSRGNKKFASGSGNAGAVTGGWYPGDEWKGDVARMMMYMYLRYNTRCLPSNVGVGSNTGTPDDMIDLFLQWNAEDPVSDFERQRNTFHENTSNTYAQGNRNPFIDNPYLATRIWGGPEAEDTWGIYTGDDTTAPTVPTNLVLTDITTSSMNLSWTASSDNVGVSSYEIYLDGNFYHETSDTSYDAEDLTPNTHYSFRVLAKDIAGNKSGQSVPANASTLADTEAPTTPVDVSISNETDASFKITWRPSNDNTGVTSYDIFLDGNLDGSSVSSTYTPNGLTANTTYAVTIVANDSSGNSSAPSAPVNATTTGSGGGSASDLFFSEYVEGSSFNKAIEIANFTGNSVDLSSYSIRRQPNGGQEGDDWTLELTLSGSLPDGDVYVVIHGNASLPTLIDEADFAQPSNSGTNFGEPVNFNGNDPVGLFKNGTLIDIIGVYDGGNGNFAQNKTLRRKPSVLQPNTTFDLVNEWDEYPVDTVDNIGQHNATVSAAGFSIHALRLYPNPVRNKLYVRALTRDATVELYSVLGAKVYAGILSTNRPEIPVNNLKPGVYLVRLTSDGKSVTKKFIKSN